MGYTTSFTGSFSLDKPLTAIHKEYLEMFAETRRMKRDEFKVATMKANGQGNKRCFELLEACGLPIGKDGDFYCGTGLAGQDHDGSITEYNFASGESKSWPRQPSTGQPGLWCQWVPNNDGTKIEWNGAEKFYDYTEWLEYLISNFLIPWGYKVNGMVEWHGEEPGDIGVIEVVDNIVTVHKDKTFKWLESDRSKTESAIAASETFSASKDKTSDIILDLVKLRNDLAVAKKGTAVATKLIDALIKKYGV